MFTKLPTDPLYLQNAFDDLGITEILGKRHNPRIVEMFHKAGFPGINDDETAWCAAALNAWVIEGGLKGSGSLLARSFLKWGKPLPLEKNAPRGSVAVFKRGSNPIYGHVAIVLEDKGGYITHIGGNQGNKVSISKTKRSELIGLRQAPSISNSVTIKTLTGSAASFTASEGFDQASNAINSSVSNKTSDGVADTLTSIHPYVEQLGSLLLWAKYAAIILGISLAIYVGYRHIQNNIKSS